MIMSLFNLTYATAACETTNSSIRPLDQANPHSPPLHSKEYQIHWSLLLTSLTQYVGNIRTYFM